MYEDHTFDFGTVARWSMSTWLLSEDEVKDAIRNPDSRRDEDESGIMVMKAQTRDFTICAHFVETKKKVIEVRNAYGQYGD